MFFKIQQYCNYPGTAASPVMRAWITECPHSDKCHTSPLFSVSVKPINSHFPVCSYSPMWRASYAWQRWQASHRNSNRQSHRQCRPRLWLLLPFRREQFHRHQNSEISYGVTSATYIDTSTSGRSKYKRSLEQKTPQLGRFQSFSPKLSKHKLRQTRRSNSAKRSLSSVKISNLPAVALATRRGVASKLFVCLSTRPRRASLIDYSSCSVGTAEHSMHRIDATRSEAREFECSLELAPAMHAVSLSQMSKMHMARPGWRAGTLSLFDLPWFLTCLVRTCTLHSKSAKIWTRPHKLSHKKSLTHPAKTKGLSFVPSRCGESHCERNLLQP